MKDWSLNNNFKTLTTKMILELFVLNFNTCVNSLFEGGGRHDK